MPSNNNLDTWFLIAVFFFVGSRKACGDGELIVADFEGGTYLGWTISGTAFGSEPATGTLPNQMQVSGYVGSRLVNTFVNGDSSVGEAISQSFVIEAPCIAFLIGGGSDANLVGKGTDRTPCSCDCRCDATPRRINNCQQINEWQIGLRMATALCGVPLPINPYC